MAEQIAGRRRALKYLGMLTGTVAGRKFLADWLPTGDAANAAHAHHHGAPADQANEATPYAAQFFKPDEFRTVELLTELIIPTDETSGAKEAQVARYIDFVVSAAGEFKPSLQREWADGLQLLDRLSHEKYQRVFHQLSTEEKEALLVEMSLPERNAEASHPGYEFYRLIKEMTVEGFYTSRVGLIDVLGYNGLDYLSEFPGCTHPEHQS